MPTGGYQIRDQYAIHFITFAVVEWVDVFSRSLYADIVVDSLRYCQQQKGLRIHAWCIMTNHVHLIVSAGGTDPLSGILRDFKKYTSGQIIRSITQNDRESRRNWMLWLFGSAGKRNVRNEDFQFWQQDNHAIECKDAEMLLGRMKYLHENPVRAGMVRQEADYVYSSGIDYYGNGSGLIRIDFLQ